MKPGKTSGTAERTTNERPLSGKEYAALQSLFAALSSLSVTTPTLEKRARTVPGAWRDLRMMQTKCDTVMQRLLTTVPVNKLRHIRADIEHARVYVKVEAPGLNSMSTEGFSYVPTDTVNALLAYVCEHDCMLCDNTPEQARTCETRKMIEKALPHEIDAADGAHCKFSDISLGLDTEA